MPELKVVDLKPNLNLQLDLLELVKYLIDNNQCIKGYAVVIDDGTGCRTRWNVPTQSKGCYMTSLLKRKFEQAIFDD